jgi:hypothetical protein
MVNTIATVSPTAAAVRPSTRDNGPTRMTVSTRPCRARLRHAPYAPWNDRYKPTREGP